MELPIFQDAGGQPLSPELQHPPIALAASVPLVGPLAMEVRMLAGVARVGWAPARIDLFDRSQDNANQAVIGGQELLQS